MDDLQQFKDTYITECNELLEDMEERLLGLEEGSEDSEELNAIFRCAHSIKGGAGAFGFNRITSFTHILEALLDVMRDGKLLPTREAIDALLKSVDILKTMVASAQKGVEAPDGLEKAVSEQLIAISEGEVKAPQISVKAEEEDDGEISLYDISFIPHKDLFLSGNEPLLIIRELKQIGEATINIDVSKVPDLKQINHEECYISWNFTLETEEPLSRVREVFEFVEDNCELKIDKIAGYAKISNNQNEKVELNDAAKPEEDTAADEGSSEGDNSAKVAATNTASAPVVTSIRVDIDKVDRLVNMVGELVITQAMVMAQSNKLSPDEHFALIQGVAALSQHTIELQEAVMSVRMQPVKSVFSRMPRVIRDLSEQLGKDIKFEMYGENTELDKTVIEQLTDPLLHMIRNSVDHGIDIPANRIAQGKPSQGLIKLSAEHVGGKIIIKIEDDGRGINREAVMAKAIENGILTPESKLSEEEIDNLIFMPGFSTAKEVSNISGRGVGMDVVRRNIEALGGTVNIENHPGEGSCMTVTLPLTLAILDGMIVRVGRELYVVPIGNIIETLRPKKEDVRTIADGNDTINVRGDYVSVMYLYKLFDIKNAETEASNGLVVLVESGHDRYGLVVDELIGQQQVVIKSLEENMEAVTGISAATILGDGKVSLILDVSKLKFINSEMERKKRENNAHLIEVVA